MKRAFGNVTNVLHKDVIGPQTHLKPNYGTLKRPSHQRSPDFPKKAKFPEKDLKGKHVENDAENKPSIQQHKDQVLNHKQFDIKPREDGRKEPIVQPLGDITTSQPKPSAEITRTIERKVTLISLSERTSVGARKLFSESEPSVKSIDFYDPSSYYVPPPQLPSDVEDFDKSQLKDICSEPHYAHDIFTYYKEKELVYASKKYLTSQSEVNKGMRGVLVDWMVEVQESFELNHETLYLAVKIVDHYCMKKAISKKNYQLLGATAMLIAAKFDERIPPALEDFVFICDDAYKKEQIIRMEIEVLNTIDFFLGFPISYRFLRRYARVSKSNMEELTLARYILEVSLMDYELIEERDSKVAAAALLLAFRMKNQQQRSKLDKEIRASREWDKSLAFYSGYTEAELQGLLYKLNDLITTMAHRPNLKTIRTKYSHKVFHEVAKIPPLELKDSH